MRRWTWLTGLLLAGCQRAPPPKPPPEAVPVSVAPVIQRPAPVNLQAIGSVDTLQTVAVKSLVAGQIEQVFFKEGDEVQKGDLLFTIDPRPFQAALAQAQGLVGRDKAQLQFAIEEEAMYSKLVGNGYVSRDQYAQAKSNAAALQAAVQAETAAVAQAQLNLEYCSIHTPITGKTGVMQVKLGNIVKANDVGIVTINQLRPIAVSFTVPATHLVEIRQQLAEHPVQVLAQPVGVKEPERGRVNFVNNAVDTTTGTIFLRSEFPNDDRALWPGQFVEVVLTLDIQPNAILTATAAVQTGQQGTYVFVMKPDQTVESRPVVVDRAIGDQSVIAKGLNPGETVVTEGQLRLVPGTKVAVRTPGKVAAPVSGEAPQGRKP